MDSLAAEQILEITATLNPPFIEGPRVLAGINGGTVTGKINGKVLPVGGEFGVFLTPTCYKIDVRAAIQADDGAIVFITYRGYMSAGDPQTLQQLFSPNGKDLDVSKYYWRTNPLFETSSPQYAWLNNTVAVGFGSYNTEGEVVYKLYAIQ
ncbi:MAG: DUF3237 domain-containing protein [Ginsengibacter sp.]